VHGFVHETRRDGLRRGRPKVSAKTYVSRKPRSIRTSETGRHGRDSRRMAHNPATTGHLTCEREVRASHSPLTDRRVVTGFQAWLTDGRWT
jgi:hypothetical protein